MGSKYVLAGDPTEWVRWILQDDSVEVEEVLSGEFRFLLRHSDTVLRVRGRQGPFVLVVEVQLRLDKRMPRRMRAYATLAEERYDLPVYPAVLYLLPPPKPVELPTHYHSEFMGLVAHQDFRAIAVWEVEARRVLEEGIVALVPFVPLMKGADEESIRAGVRLLRERDVGEETEVALALFASLVMDVEQIRRIVRWDMIALRESPWFKQIIEEGRQIGLKEGLKMGFSQGVDEGFSRGINQGQVRGIVAARRSDIIHLLRLRFDPIGPRLLAIADSLESIEDADALRELLTQAALSESLDDFQEYLNQYLEEGTYDYSPVDF